MRHEAELPVVPAPVRAERRPGAPLELRPGARVVVGQHPDAVSVATLIAQRIGLLCGFPVGIAQVDDGVPGTIVLQLAADRATVGVPDDLADDLATDAYRLEVSAQRATVTALHPAGLLRGAVTLQQLSRREGPNAPYTFDPALVVDHPRFAWRGLSLDVARHFFGVADVKLVLDRMNALKLNVLHLHLTDDQGWRLEIPGRPELTERSGTTAVDGDPGGYYTTGDFAEIVTYAASRHIAVVPEIDLPGHVNAALHACGDLTPSGEPAPAYTGTDVGFSRLHADLPATAAFLNDVLSAVAAMTRGQHVHVGGDEVLTMDRAEYSRLVHAALAELAAGGKDPVGWQEVASASPPPGTVLQYWDERAGAEQVVAAVESGALLLLSPASRVYLDMRYDEATPMGNDWAGHIEVRDSYEWEPLDLLPVPPDRVVGVEAALWTENVRTREDLFTLLLPRLAAVAEVAWSAPERRSWESFAARLPAQTGRWDEAGLSWYRSPQVEW